MFAMDMKEDLKIFSHRRAARDGFGGWRLEELEEGINLGDLEKKTSGEAQAYWLLSVKAARRAFLIRGQRAQAALRRNYHSHG